MWGHEKPRGSGACRRPHDGVAGNQTPLLLVHDSSRNISRHSSFCSNWCAPGFETTGEQPSQHAAEQGAPWLAPELDPEGAQQCALPLPTAPAEDVELEKAERLQGERESG